MATPATAPSADERVSAWMCVDRSDIARRLAESPAVKPLNIGFSVDVGDEFPRWCPDMGAVRRLLLARALCAASVRDGP